jgi:hypothetical protein
MDYLPPCPHHHSQPICSAINDAFYSILDDPIGGLNSVDLCRLVHPIATTYAQISQPNLNNNMANFNAGIDPGLPLVIYTRKQAGVCARRGSTHLQGYHGHHRDKARTRMRQYDHGVAQVEPSTHCQSHLVQIETPLDNSFFQNKQNQPHDSRQGFIRSQRS